MERETVYYTLLRMRNVKLLCLPESIQLERKPHSAIGSLCSRLILAELWWMLFWVSQYLFCEPDQHVLV